MNVLVLTSSFPRYMGDYAGSVVYELIKALSKEEDIKIHVVAPSDINSETFERLHKNIYIYRFNYFSPQKWQKVAYGYGMPINLKESVLAKIQFPLFVLSFFLTGLRIAINQCDVIHANFILSGLIAIPIKKIIKKPVVLTVRGSDLRMMPKFLSKFALKKADAIISPHPELTEIVRSMGCDVIEIPNVTDDNKFNPNIDASYFKEEFDITTQYIISFIGRLYEFKDPITFVKSVPHVLARDKNVKFFVVGDGPLKEKIKELVEKLNLQKFVILTGIRDDVNIILKNSTIFTALSPIENIWSNVIVESMKCGTPCIVTRSGLTGKYLVHKQSAYLVPPKNEVELANAILYLLEHIELREKLSKTAIGLMEELGFSTENAIKKTIEVYRNVTIISQAKIVKLLGKAIGK